MLRRECRGVAAALDGATREGAWLASGPLRPGVRLGRRGEGDDGVFRVGNAAGEAHPIVGEGISMALQSAFVLAALIGPARAALVAAATAHEAQRRALDAYEALWRRRFTRRLRVAAAFAHIAMRPALARVAWPLARRWPGVLTAGARLSDKTRCAPEATPRWSATRHEGDGDARRPLRFDRVDALRGVAIVWMAAFHFCFDLNYFRFIRQNFYRDPFWTVQRACIVTLFMACVGAGQAIASAQRPAAGSASGVAGRRSPAARVLVSLGSWLMFPRSFISFGVLHGIAVMLVIARLTPSWGAWRWPLGLVAIVLPQLVARSVLRHALDQLGRPRHAACR